jgi:hypothetical protein
LLFQFHAVDGRCDSAAQNSSVCPTHHA